MTFTNSFRDLEVWREAMTLVEEIYALSRAFPAEERYVLTSQIRRAAISIASNIAEGARRKRRKANLYHLDVALGSQAEVETQVEIGERLSYCSSKQAQLVQDRIARIGRILNGLISSLQPTDSDWNQ